MTDRFTFFRSYREFARCLPDAESKAEYYEMLAAYALDGTVPPEDSRFYGVFALVRPTIDRSAARSAAGQRGGSKSASKVQANAKQSASKHEVKCKQNASKHEANANECASDIGVGEGIGVGVGGCTPRDGVPLAKRLPTRQEMAMAAHAHSISNEDLERFYKEMEERRWTYMSHGNVVEVNRRNFATCLSSWVRMQVKIDRERSAGKGVNVYHQEGYEPDWEEG